MAASVIMTERNEPFYNNQLYQLLTKATIHSNEALHELNSILHQQPELASLTHPIDGTYLHVISRRSAEHEK